MTHPGNETNDFVPSETNDMTELRHGAIRDRDRIVGLTAEVDTLRNKLAEMVDSDVSVAYARIDILEDEREALIDELHRSIIRERDVLERLDAVIVSLRKDIEMIRGSTTWRVGSAVVAPMSVVSRRVRRQR